MKYLVWIILLFLFSAAYLQKDTRKVEVGENVVLQLPLTLQPASEEDIRQRYVSARPPLALFTSQDRQADFGVNINATPWGEQDMALLKDIYKSNIYSLYDSVALLREEISEINDRPFILLEFMGQLNPDENAITQTGALRKYNYLAYAVKDYKVYLFYFNSPAAQAPAWRPHVEEIMQNIRIK